MTLKIAVFAPMPRPSVSTNATREPRHAGQIPERDADVVEHGDASKLDDSRVGGRQQSCPMRKRRKPLTRMGRRCVPGGPCARGIGTPSSQSRTSSGAYGHIRIMQLIRPARGT